MRVLGLDPSLTAFGWALHDTTATGPARCEAHGRYNTSSKMLFVDRYVFMRETLRQLIQRLNPDRVGIESPFFGGSYSEGMYGLFLYSNEALKLERRDVVYFSPGQIKAHARESIKRPAGWDMMKPDMVEAAKADTGIKKPFNHNEADAYLCARLAGRFWGYLSGIVKDTDLTSVEKRLFSEVHVYQRGKHAGQTERKGLIYREEDRFFRWSQLPESHSVIPGVIPS